jgi:hypothetical protein
MSNPLEDYLSTIAPDYCAPFERPEHVALYLLALDHRTAFPLSDDIGWAIYGALTNIEYLNDCDTWNDMNWEGCAEDLSKVVTLPTYDNPDAVTYHVYRYASGSWDINMWGQGE